MELRAGLGAMGAGQWHLRSSAEGSRATVLGVPIGEDVVRNVGLEERT